MDKSFMIFIAIGLGFLYFVTTFVGDIQAEDEVYRNNDYDQEHKYDMYKTVDSIGQDVLDVTGANSQTQVSAWNELKIAHEKVHTNVQNYIYENSKHVPQSDLSQKALDIENDTLSVFEKLNDVLRMNCKG